jgi:hypothetical protein
MDNSALYPNASAVYDADFMISLQPGLVDIFLNKVGYIAGLEGMQIDRILYWQFHGLCHLGPWSIVMASPLISAFLDVYINSGGIQC